MCQGCDGEEADYKVAENPPNVALRDVIGYRPTLRLTRRGPE
jgi:hypothetical protein